MPGTTQEGHKAQRGAGPESLEKAFLQILLTKGATLEKEMMQILSTGVSDAFLPVVLWQTQSGGKRFRPVLTILFAEALGNPDPEITVAAACGIELLHNCSLIFDDIIDHGTVRRNRPTVRAEYSDDFAILAVMQHREAVTECALRTGTYAGAVERIYSEAMRCIIEGERLDILFEQGATRRHEYFQRNRYREISFDDYFQMSGCKTAALIAAACKLGVLVAGGETALQRAAEEYGQRIGLAFQMLDDYLDIFSEPYSKAFGKEPYKDIKERKLGNYVLLKALAALPQKDGQKLLSLLRGPDGLCEDERVCRAKALIEKAAVREGVRQDACRWAESAKQAIVGKLTGTATDPLRMIADFMAYRNF